MIPIAQNSLGIFNEGKSISACLDQFLAMAFAQLACRESLRDIEIHLRAQAGRLNHMGFRCATISRNTLCVAPVRGWLSRCRCHLRFFGRRGGLLRGAATPGLASAASLLGT